MPIQKEIVENMRRAMNTLPSQKAQKVYDYMSVYDPRACNVKLVEYPDNPYKMIVRAATATWGTGKVGYTEGVMHKWEKLSPEARFCVVLAALTGNTLPQALEPVVFQWEINGLPRHTFDQFARMRIGAGIFSIGCRDNNKLDAPWVLYPELYQELMHNDELKAEFEQWTIATKDLYEKILNTGSGSWQTARAVLPMSYNHSWGCYTTLLTLKGQMAQRLKFCEEAPIVLLFWRMKEEIQKQFPLINNYLRPACDWVKRCTYHGKHEGLTKYFSNLFASCGRWPCEVDYQEFNRSCTIVNEIKEVVTITPPTDWIEFTENDFDKLDNRDKQLFYQD